MLFILLLFVFFALIVALLLFGPVEIEPSQVIKILFAGDQGAVGRDSIFWNYRIPKMLTAIAAGGAMALSGLLMQTYFQNPLAGPFVLGINSGATLGVAAWIIGISLLPDLGWLSFSGAGGVIAAAVGAMATLIIVILLSTWVSGKATLLIVGLIFGYIANGLINVMVITSSSQELQSLLLWSLGSFTRVSGHQLVILLLIVTIGVALAITLSKRLNVMLLGDLYAISSGINIALVKLGVIVITGTLCGAVTALCGPVAFLGIVAPHLTKVLFNSHDHRILIPAVFLMGAVLAMGAELLISTWSHFTLPLNAILGILGAPAIIFYLLRTRKQMRQME